MRSSVYVIDDDPVDLMAIERAVARSGLDVCVHAQSDPIRAVEELRELAHQPGAAMPLVVLLDLNMEGMGGFECLQEIRSDPALRRSVVFICSTSNNPSDVARSYDHGVAGYLVKNDLGLRYDKLVDLLEAYVAAVVPCPTEP